jgi:Xaa-Pro aminopeptidase
MFNKDIYIERRKTLKTLVGEGIIVFFGYNESPCNYPANAYYPMRQD